MFFRFKQNKNIVNVTSVNYSFEMRKTLIKPNFFIMTKNLKVRPLQLCRFVYKAYYQK